MHEMQNSDYSLRRVGAVVRRPCLLPADKDPNFLSSLSALRPISLPASPFPLSIVDDESDRDVRLAACNNRIGFKSRRRLQIPCQTGRVAFSISSRNTYTGVKPPSSSGTLCISVAPRLLTHSKDARKSCLIKRPRQPRLIYNRTSRHPDTDEGAVDVEDLEASADQISQSRLEGSRHRRQSQLTDDAAIRESNPVRVGSFTCNRRSHTVVPAIIHPNERSM